MAHKRKAKAIMRELKGENTKRLGKARNILKHIYELHEQRLKLALEKIRKQRAAHERLLRDQKARLNKMIEKRGTQMTRMTMRCGSIP